MTLETELSKMIRAKYPIIWIETYEETRALKLVSGVSKSINRWCAQWTVTNGLTEKGIRVDGTESPQSVIEHILNTNHEGVFILRDYHHYVEDPLIQRLLRDVYIAFERGNLRRTLVLISPTAKVPPDLQKEIAVVSLDLPDDTELHQIYSDLVQNLPDEIAEKVSFCKAEDAVRAGRGLTSGEFRNVLAKGIAGRSVSAKEIIAEKSEIIKNSGILEYISPEDTLDSVGGLEALKGWIKKAGKRFTKEAEDYGLEKPKGVLLIGPPGTGKSLSAKVIADTLGIPLLRLDAGGVSSKFYGETTNKLKQALKLAEAVSPCVLWLDEVEKMLSTGQDGGHEETQRALSVLLTHFEECSAPILRVGTCNDHRSLKPELLQRFEKIFFVDLPNIKERESIFQIHLKKIGRTFIDSSELARTAEGFVGREIKVLIKEALSTAFDEERELTPGDIEEEIRRTTPTSVQRKTEIETLRSWARSNATPASIQTQRQPQVGRIVEVL